MGLAKLIDGAAVAAALRGRVADEATHLRDEIGTAPGLATILVGENPASQVYVRAKGRACAGSGLTALDIRLPGDCGSAPLPGISVATCFDKGGYATPPRASRRCARRNPQSTVVLSSEAIASRSRLASPSW